MSPILVRPVREQLEHDRVIRILQLRLKRKHELVANIGEDQSTPVKIGQLQIYPDILLMTADKARKLLCTVEVETSESVNHLEARAQWAHLGRARAPFHLYVPTNSVDIARRLATENDVNVAEIWSFHTIGDQTRFTLVHRAPERRTASKTVRKVDAAKGPKPMRQVAAAEATPAAGPGGKKSSAKKRTSPAPRRPARATAKGGAGAPAARKGTSGATASQKRK